MSMDESVRIAKFSVLVDDICGLVNGSHWREGRRGLVILLDGQDRSCFEKEYHIDPSLLFIFDYDKLNKFAQIIMEKCPIIMRWNCRQWRENAREGGIYAYSDVKDSIRKIKEFVSSCREEEEKKAKLGLSRYDRYKFIFWSLMILAVDKTEEDKHISLICNFAKMLDITDKEIQDMIHIVKLIFNKVDSDYEFQSDRIVGLFGKVLTKYNCEL